MLRFVAMAVAVFYIYGGMGKQLQGQEFSKKVLTIFETHCGDCHAGGAEEGGFGDIDDLKKVRSSGRIVLKNAVGSKLYLKIAAGEMPPPGEEPADRRLTREEIDAVRDWISQGAPTGDEKVEDSPKRREPISLRAELDAVQTYLEKRVPRMHRRFQRFFSFRNIHNHPRRTAQELDFHRAALGKVLNSLTWRVTIVKPVKVDPAGTLYAINLRQLNWDAHLWEAMLAHYPYALKHDSLPEDRAIQETARSIQRESDCDASVVRADWFIVAATRAPLYETLLRLPHSLDALERKLGVDATRNLREGMALRVGMKRSGISEQHRLIERHEGEYGYYWKSYDFKRNTTKGNLTRFPFGPPGVFPQLSRSAFVHDGGEFIFRLPNGMQAYYLADARGNPLPGAAPTDIVADGKKTTGTVEIFNGISCIACHSQGIIEKKDEVRTAAGRYFGESRELLELLYPQAETMAPLFAADRRSFQQAARSAMEDMVQDKSIISVEGGAVLEPVFTVARFYFKELLSAEDLAVELGLESTEKLLAAVRHRDQLQEFGLGPLLEKDGFIRRETWERPGRRRSLFQITANVLELGVPFRIARPGGR